MREELALRQARFHVHVDSGSEAVKRWTQPEHSPVVAKEIAPEDIRNEASLGVEWPNSELSAQQVKVAASKIEQRTDPWIGLAIIIAEMALEVSRESGKAEV